MHYSLSNSSTFSFKFTYHSFQYYPIYLHIFINIPYNSSKHDHLTKYNIPQYLLDINHTKSCKIENDINTEHGPARVKVAPGATQTRAPFLKCTQRQGNRVQHQPNLRAPMLICTRCQESTTRY